MPQKTRSGNLGLKILAVFLATSLWFYVNYRGQSDTVVDAAIDFKNIPRGMEILKQGAKKVSLTVRAHERIIQGIKPTDLHMVVDLANGKKGENSLTLDDDDVISPRAVKVLRIDPPSIKVILDESDSRNVPVRAALVGSPLKGYRVTSTEVTPAIVAAEGPKSEVSKVSLLRTEAIDVSGLDSGFTQEVRVNLGGRNIRLSMPEVTVRINIEKEK